MVVLVSWRETESGLRGWKLVVVVKSSSSVWSVGSSGQINERRRLWWFVLFEKKARDLVCDVGRRKGQSRGFLRNR